jgi:hypothetical protein
MITLRASATGPDGQVVLIWDVHAAHRDAVVKANSTELKIPWIYIPSEMRDKFQPLDRRIFGRLKVKAKTQVVRCYGGHLTLVQSLQAMIKWIKDQLIDNIEKETLEFSGESFIYRHLARLRELPILRGSGTSDHQWIKDSTNDGLDGIVEVADSLVFCANACTENRSRNFRRRFRIV